MRDDAAFIRMIADNPDDDTPRLVYADVLEESGEPLLIARAEFIRVQIERTRPNLIQSQRTALWKRETELLGHAQAWRKSLPQFVHLTWGGFVRGFIERVDLVFGSQYALPPLEEPLVEDEILAILEVAFDHMPIRHLSIAGAQLEDVEHLLDWPSFGALRSLYLPYVRLTPDGLKRVMHDPNLRNVSKLDLRGIPIGLEAVRTIIHSPLMRNLTSLCLRHTGIDAQGVRALAGCPEPTQLQRLDVANNEISQALLTSLRARFGHEVVYMW